MSREERAVIAGNYVVDGLKLRTISELMNVSKSTIQRDLARVLPKAQPSLYAKVRKALRHHKSRYFEERGT